MVLETGLALKVTLLGGRGGRVASGDTGEVGGRRGVFSDMVLVAMMAWAARDTAVAPGWFSHRSDFTLSQIVGRLGNGASGSMKIVAD